MKLKFLSVFLLSILPATACFPVVCRAEVAIPGSRDNRRAELAQGNSELLFNAVRRGNLQDVIALVRDGADVTSVNILMETPLHVAARGTSMEIVRFLVEQGASVNAETINGETPLHMAARGTSLEIVQFLVEQGASVNAETINGETPLHVAAQNGRVDIAGVFIGQNVNINAVDESGSTALHAAVGDENLDMVTLLVNSGIDVDVADEDTGDTALIMASSRGNLGIVRYLVEHGHADATIVGDFDCDALGWAVLSGQLAVVRYFIEDRGIDFDANILLRLAFINANADMIRYLINHGADVNTECYGGVTVLHRAVEVGDLGLVRYLVEECNARIDLQDNMHRTPLMIAQEEHYTEIVDYLNRYMHRGIEPPPAKRRRTQ